MAGLWEPIPDRLWPQVVTQSQAAGIPDHVWNMAGKAGVTPETDDAGIDLNDVRSTETPSKL